jgi:hypothetical protein
MGCVSCAAYDDAARTSQTIDAGERDSRNHPDRSRELAHNLASVSVGGATLKDMVVGTADQMIVVDDPMTTLEARRCDQAMRPDHTDHRLVENRMNRERSQTQT